MIFWSYEQIVNNHEQIVNKCKEKFLSCIFEGQWVKNTCNFRVKNWHIYYNFELKNWQTNNKNIVKIAKKWHVFYNRIIINYYKLSVPIFLLPYYLREKMN